jgi:hypothetical protein
MAGSAYVSTGPAPCHANAIRLIILLGGGKQRKGILHMHDGLTWNAHAHASSPIDRDR